MNRSLLTIRHLDADTIHEMIDLAASFRTAIMRGETLRPKDPKVIGLLFFESSTRTRVSFEQATSYLGYRFTNFSSSGSSMSKGETLKDTILTLRSERLDGVVMRHRASGAPFLAHQLFDGHVVNAGDGEHEHPTQALGDALTVLSHLKSIQGLNVAIVGDVLHSRVARSNAWLFHKLGADVRLIGPRTLMPTHGGLLPGRIFHDLEPGIEDADVVMCLRLQKERMQDGLMTSTKEYRKMYQVNQETLRWARPGALVMHPGPLNRGVELDDFAADGPQSMILQQVENGIYVRMAALHWIFAQPQAKKAAKATEPPAEKTSKKKSSAGAKA